MSTKPLKHNVLLADTPELREKAFQIRQEVFVDEQKVPREDEFDQYEDIAHHFVILEGEEPVGAARWRKTDKGVKLERFVVKKTHRGLGLGSLLVEAAMEDIKKTLGAGQYLYLHAQLTAMFLYERAGFQKTGPQFSECDILHYKMERYL